MRSAPLHPRSTVHRTQSGIVVSAGAPLTDVPPIFSNRAIWWFTPTPLQHWSRRNAFGNLRVAPSAYKTADEQAEELGKAIEKMS